RLGLLMNGMVKIPMQFCILLIGALLFSFYTLHKAPLFFNESAQEKVAEKFPETYRPIYIGHEIASINNKKTALELIALRHKDQPDESRRQLLLQELKDGQDFLQQQRLSMQDLIANHQDGVAEPPSDTNYIFLHFVRHYLPAGMVGLLFAIIFLASWSSISAAINALASSSLIDFHQVLFTRSELSEGQ